MKIHFWEFKNDKLTHEWWPNLSAWVLVRAFIKWWLPFAIDFPWSMLCPLKFAVRPRKAIKLKSFLQIRGVTNNSSFFTTNQYDAGLFTATLQYLLAPSLIGMNHFTKGHYEWLWGCEQNLLIDIFFFLLAMLHVKRVVHQNISTLLQTWGVKPWGGRQGPRQT